MERVFSLGLQHNMQYFAFGFPWIWVGLGAVHLVRALPSSPSKIMRDTLPLLLLLRISSRSFFV
jgi:hypothetical protein